MCKKLQSKRRWGNAKKTPGNLHSHATALPAYQKDNKIIIFTVVFCCAVRGTGKLRRKERAQAEGCK